MRRLIFASFLLLLVAVVAARADVLDFNNLQIGEQVLGYYDGGTGSLGTGPGPNFGITFTSDFVTVEQGVFGPPLRAEELMSTSGIMDVALGFSGPFSFYYTNSGADGSVKLYAGIDGSGALVDTIPLMTEATFTPAGAVEALPFESAVFAGNADTLVFDDITLGGGLVIPEPSSAWLLFTVVLAVYLGRSKDIMTAYSISRPRHCK